MRFQMAKTTARTPVTPTHTQPLMLARKTKMNVSGLAPSHSEEMRASELPA